MEKLQEFLRKHPQSKILDVGTGRGNFIDLLDYLDKGYAKIVGIDIMDRLVEMASEHFASNKKIKIIQKNILDTGFPKEHFDIVCLSNSLHHLEDIPKTFRAMEELVKPGGYLLFNEMMKDNQNARQQSHIMIHHFSAKLDREIGMFHDDTYNRHEIIDTIEKNTSFKLEDAWDMEVPKAEANSQEEIDHMLKTVDALLARLGNDDLIAKHKEEGESIKTYIRENGIEACTQLLVLAKRNK